MVRPVLLSLLVRQSLALGARFPMRYPHAWLVWEPGVWHVPDADEKDVAATQHATPDLRDCLPSGEDALCYELRAPEGLRALTLGRATTNHLVVNDATVSREHLALTPVEDDGWLVTRVNRANAVSLDSQALAIELPARLTAGARLELGEIQLTFHDRTGFVARVSALAQQAVERVTGR